MRDAVRRFQAILDQFTNELGNLAAIAAIEVHGRGRLYLASGYADLTKAELATTGHLYQIGSQSKTALAVLMLILERQKRVRLDDPFVRYLTLPIDDRITLRHLLMNQSGLGEPTFAMPHDRRDPRVIYAPRDLVALALPQGQLFEPGSRFDYSNTGWVIAAMIIEEVLGLAYADAIRRLLLEPLELSDTYFGTRLPTERMLHGYLSSPATAGPVDAAGCLSWAFGAGDGVSTLDNMLGFYEQLRVPSNAIGIHLEDLTRQTGRPSATPYSSFSIGAQYGLGIERRAWAGAEVWGHPGSTSAYMSGTWIDLANAVTVSTCVTRSTSYPPPSDTEQRYPRAQLFAMALDTAYQVAADHEYVFE